MVALWLCVSIIALHKVGVLCGGGGVLKCMRFVCFGFVGFYHGR